MKGKEIIPTEENLMIPADYIGPFLTSNGIAILLIPVALLWPKVARILFGLIFTAAALFNGYTALTDASAYLMYGEVAVLPIYRDFIYGAFSQSTALFIFLIASGQLAVGVMLLIGTRLPLALGTLGGIIFLTAIAPLGFGSAFPFSLFVIAALVIMYRRLNGWEGLRVQRKTSQA